MKNITSLALVLISSNLLVGCIMGDNEAPEQMQQDQTADDADMQPDVIPFPRTCAEVAKSHPGAADGDHTLFVDHVETKPWVAYCVDMDTDAPREYLTLSAAGPGTWSKLVAGGSITGTDVDTRFDKIRIDAATLKVDTSDLTFAVSTGSATLASGTEVHAMPLGVGMTCGGGYASAQVSIDDTAFTIASTFSVAGAAGATGHADLWWTNQTMEMWADGDCAWVGPDAMPANPVNAAGGFVLQLAYK